jgi:putative addiction module component (TIGR02574 family)
MTEVATRLKDELLQLPPDDRAALAHLLWESLDGPASSEVEVDNGTGTAELERRSAEAEAGCDAGQPFRDVIAELRGERS